MEYIKSKDIFILMRETLRLIHPRLMDHGSRVAYMVCKMLEDKGGYEEFELADIAMVATLHDIGAYKTEAGVLNDMLRYESRDSRAHTIYGYLFFKYLSPVEDLAKVIMYHHTDYEQLRKVDYAYKDLAAYINIAERMDIYHTAMGSQFNMQMFHKQAGIKLSDEGLDLFYQTAKKNDIFTKLKTGEYKEELEGIIDYMIFSNEDKKKFLEMLMYCTGFRNESLVIDTTTTVCICDELANRLMLTADEKEKLYYGALLHDLGMLAIPKEIVEAPRVLNSEEIKMLRKHVAVTEKVLGNRMRDDIVAIATGHHERGDGSGYPKKLKNYQMTQEQRILQVADAVTGMTNKRSYRDALPKEKVVSILEEESAKGRLNKQVVSIFITYYDTIMQSVQTESAEIMKMYQTLNSQYEQVSKRFRI
ncbi:MAG: HD domain-containing protein [Blautia sp.]|nr:HD domain-containing protein [Lachnoclostridium sp.]MCM1209990.1 HD domain-containing protein [Blautia sp.]